MIVCIGLYAGGLRSGGDIKALQEILLADKDRIIEEAGLNPLNYVHDEDPDTNNFFFITATPEQIEKIAEMDIVKEICLPAEEEAVEWYYEAFEANNSVGDANLDGKVSIADATAIVQYIGNGDKYPLSMNGANLADCHNKGDGITALDALAIQKLEAKIIESF